ncbi:hypothetical protein [Methylobacterium trifolii]|uniref:DUF1508 domain-containing protein n=1 Tax=Methylobacterium trifolii TaxID=1003092 RepID=A0ABQ4TVB8_9HYPH|nr:hypothetical protein [Methylobacterium trifolii]GJE58757.1 hypothetical protein MPOCJGCO_0840 [Methylobacterium trifolii]
MRFDITEDAAGRWFWTLFDARARSVLCSPVRFTSQVQAYADAAVFKALVSGAEVKTDQAPKGSHGPAADKQLGLL